MRECNQACPTARMVRSTQAFCVLRAQRALCSNQVADLNVKMQTKQRENQAQNRGKVANATSDWKGHMTKEKQ
jgi:hypothetical protein